MIAYIRRRDNIIAVVATQPLLVVLQPRRRPVPHHQKAVKAQCSIDDYLALRRAEHRWQPSRFSRVHQQEDGIMGSDKILELLDICLCLGFGSWRDRMAGHGDHEAVRLGILSRSATLSLPLAGS